MRNAKIFWEGAVTPPIPTQCLWRSSFGALFRWIGHPPL